jgi:nucleoside-diphosphate-sugar epimerase
MQTILGAGGAIGRDLAKSLSKYTDKIRLVGRNPKKVNETDELMAADLSSRDAIFKAVEGSDIVYITIGFDYKTKVWREKWPSFMKNVIDACKQHQAKLVFFDNVYMYDRDFIGNMTEDTPIRPTSKKGQVRAQIAKMVADEFGKGELTALIARSADFYGPDNDKSVLGITVIDNFKKGKAANWFIRTDKIHNFTFTPEAGLATAMLGNTPDAYNQVWHLPTNSSRLTGKQWIELIAKEMKVAKSKTMVMPGWMLSILALFMSIMKELKEMTYQYDRDYFFDSSKFEKRFSFKPISPEEGIKAAVGFVNENP